MQVDRTLRTTYTTGATPLFAAQADQRFSYCLYVPTGHTPAALPLPILVIQHGTPRTAMACRDRYVDFAEEQRCIVLAPLFPAGIGEPMELNGYKLIAKHGVRYDRVLLSIVDEVAAAYNARSATFYLHGFSGGGQFAHRFYYLHPDRLDAVSVGAPGRITELDDSLPWWLGTQDVEERFGTRIDPAALQKVPVHLVIGSADTETWEINDVTSADWMSGATRTGETRLARIQALRTSLETQGIQVQLDVVDGAAHDDREITPAVQAFMARHLRERR
jgi:poly(3-hydroxybutyrate) depolymerase